MDTEKFMADAKMQRDAIEFGPLMDDIRKEYPAIAKHNFRVTRGEGEGYSEFYPPWEDYNPTPGVPTIEVRNKDVKGKWLGSLLAGETLHHLGSLDPEGKPVDKKYRALKDAFLNSMNDEQLLMERFRHQRAAAEYGDKRTFEEYMDNSAVDAYLRGYLFPDEKNEWKRPGVYTKQQEGILDEMQQYLRSGK